MQTQCTSQVFGTSAHSNVMGTAQGCNANDVFTSRRPFVWSSIRSAVSNDSRPVATGRRSSSLARRSLGNVGNSLDNHASSSPSRSAVDTAPARTPTAPLAGPADVQPSFPIRAAFFYLWFPEAWKQRGIRPFTHYAPAAGFYDSSRASVIRRQIADMQYARIAAGIASWWGRGSTSDIRFARLLAMTDSLSSRFRWAIYYEPEGQGDPTVDQLVSDLSYLRSHYGSDPSYLRVHGRFVVFVYAQPSDRAGMADRWKKANAAISNGAYIDLKVFPGYKAIASQPDSWHQYAPATAEDFQSGYSFSISPGFWKASESIPRLVRNLARWRQQVADMVASRAPWQLVTTFNEWGEGTAVESAIQWASKSGRGAYLDLLRSSLPDRAAQPITTASSGGRPALHSPQRHLLPG